jgi:broad specificity phosphatase PhoE
MAKMYVIQTGRTVWDEQTRVESAPGAPLTQEGQQDVQEAARELAAHAAITTIYASDGQAEQQTAHLIARTLGAKVRTSRGLREIDYGLWQGLTQEQIKRRQPRLFRQWIDSPATVRPPGGESLDEVQQRLCKAVRGILKRHRNGQALVVLRPVALGLLKCLVRRDRIESLWQNVQRCCLWDVLEPDQELLNGS